MIIQRARTNVDPVALFCKLTVVTPIPYVVVMPGAM